MKNKFVCIILCFFLITITYLNTSVSAVELDSNHFLLNYGSTQKVFRNLPAERYNPETDYFLLNLSNNLFSALVLKNAKTLIAEKGYKFFVSESAGYLLFQSAYDNGSSVVRNQFKFDLLEYKSSSDSWSYVSNYTYLLKNDNGNKSSYVYSPIPVYYGDLTSYFLSPMGYIGNPPYIANSDDQLSGLTVGEVSIVPNGVLEGSLTLSLYCNTTEETIFTQYLKDIKNLSDYVSRVDIDDPFSDLAYNLPWQIFPEFDFIEGYEYQLMLNYAGNVSPITKTFIVTKSIKNTDIPLSNPPATPTPTPTVDPNQGLIDSNKETQNILNDQTNAIKENTETNKNIFQKIGDILSFINPFSENFFAYKLVSLLIEGLKGLFVPEDGFFSDYFNEIKTWFSDRLGFLWSPFDFLIELLTRITNINFGEPKFNVPDIYDPFTNQKIISATEFNFNDLLSNSILKTAHDIYLIIVDGFIIFGLYKLISDKIEGVFTK